MFHGPAHLDVTSQQHAASIDTEAAHHQVLLGSSVIVFDY